MWKRSMITAFSNAHSKIKTRFENHKTRWKGTLYADMTVCVFFNMLINALFYTADKLNVSLWTILRGDSTLN